MDEQPTAVIFREKDGKDITIKVYADGDSVTFDVWEGDVNHDTQVVEWGDVVTFLEVLYYAGV